MSPSLFLKPLHIRVSFLGIREETDMDTNGNMSDGLRTGSEEREPGQGPSKRRRLNRVITACNTCRKLKTRCEITTGKRACRRCTSLRIDCELPTLDTEPSPDDSAPSDEIRLRLSRIERQLEDLTTLVRSVIKPHVSVVPSPSSTFHQSPSNALSLNGNGSSKINSTGVTRPVLLLRNLQTRFFGPKRDFSDEALALGSVAAAGIVSPSLARYLIQIFVKHYGVWITVDRVEDLPADMEQVHPLLFSTACLLASRHVPSITKSVIQEMYLLVRRLAASVVLRAPPLNYETLQGLLLLSMFSPTIQTAMPIDSWLISGIGINHAALSFNFAGNEPVPSDQNDAQLRRLRIWNGLCLTNIQFSIGNARPSMIQPRFVEYCSQILDFPDARCEDARLYAEVELYTKTERMLSHGQQPDVDDSGLVYRELEQWRISWTHIFDHPQCLTLKFGYWFCLLLLYRASLRAEAESTLLRNATLQTSSDILMLFLEMEFSVVLDMPDHFFFIAAYAALTLCKLAISNPLIAATQTCLKDLAPNDEHIAYRFGIVLAEIRKKALEAGQPVTTAEEEEHLEQQQPPQPNAGGQAVSRAAQFLTTNDNYTWEAFLAGCYPQGFTEGELWNMANEDAVTYGNTSY